MERSDILMNERESYERGVVGVVKELVVKEWRNDVIIENYVTLIIVREEKYL